MLHTEWERPSTLFQKIPARPGRTAGEVRELENVAMGVRMRVAAAALALLAAGCTANASHLAASPTSLPPDPHTAAALLKIATAFNHDYDTGDYGRVYTRWDARSQAIITRADYLRRHKDCPGGSHRSGRSQHEAQRCGPRRDRLAGPVAGRAAGVPDGPVGPGPLALMSFCRPGETGVIALAGRADGFRPIPLSASIAAAGRSS